ncbi:dihydrolipoyl dehydrogenase [Gemmatimonadota bacterium]
MVMGQFNAETELAIIGGGPGGYVAALRAADLGKEVILIEEREELGGVCLTEGCIPSKTLINAVDLVKSAKKADKMGLTFSDIAVDREALLAWSDKVVKTLTGGVNSLVKRRGIEVVHGRARFTDENNLYLEGAGTIRFKECIIATGSRINELPTAYDVPVWSSAEALRLPEIPETLLVVGGGYIGLEMGLVYAGLGSKVTMVDFSPRFLDGADADLVEIMVKYCEECFEEIRYDSKVTGIREENDGFAVDIEHEGAVTTGEYDRVLVAIGRRPNTDDLGLENTSIEVNDRGLIPVDETMRTSVSHIFAIGDVVPGPALAHKASREGKVAAEAAAGHTSAFDNRAIPAVVFTDPEIAWTGLTEREAEAQGIPVTVGRFPLRALGRARTLGRVEGLVKVIADPESSLVLGVGMVGPHVSELISEGTLAIEMGATLEDLMVTVHPHPTLSEAIMEAAEVAAGAAIHLPPAK